MHIPRTASLSPRRTPHAPLRRLAPAFVAVLALAGCSDKPGAITPSETISAERFDAVEKELLALKSERDSLLRGASVSSSEALALATELKAVKARLVDLESRPVVVASGTTPTPATDGSGPMSGSAYPLPPVIGIPIPADSSSPYSEEQLAAFRRMSDEVDKRKELEQRAERLKRDLVRAGVNISATEEAALLKVQESFTDKMRELYRSGGGATDADRQAIMAKRDELRTQFANEVRSVVPASEADKIIEATSRMGGFRPRPDGSSAPGVRGARGG